MPCHGELLYLHCRSCSHTSIRFLWGLPPPMLSPPPSPLPQPQSSCPRILTSTSKLEELGGLQTRPISWLPAPCSVIPSSPQLTSFLASDSLNASTANTITTTTDMTTVSPLQSRADERDGPMRSTSLAPSAATCHALPSLPRLSPFLPASTPLAVKYLMWVWSLCAILLFQYQQF